MTIPIDQIDHAIVAKSHSSMYLMHKYWARKPHNVVSEYIKHYSNINDIVLDPFAGSGVTIAEAIALKRRAIACDLDPMSTFITRCTVEPANIDELNSQFKIIENKLESKVSEFYLTTCPECKEKVQIEATIWDNNRPTQIRYHCSCKTTTLWKDVDGNDEKLISKINKQMIPYWYPENELVWNSRVNVNRDTKVSDLFTKRNLYILSAIYNEIQDIEDGSSLKRLFQFCFTASLGQASKLVFVYEKEGRESFAQ